MNGDGSHRGAKTTQPTLLVKSFFARISHFTGKFLSRLFQSIKKSLLFTLWKSGNSLIRDMKFLILIVAALALNSCNTFIGIGRDTKQGYQWTKSKFQGSGGGGGSYDDASGAPVY